MKAQYSWRSAALKMLFYPECQVCRLRPAAFRGYLCVSCMRSILKDFFSARGDESVLLNGSPNSRRLVGVLRESRYQWAQIVFLKFYRKKFPEPHKVDWLTTVPQRQKDRPTGLSLFCNNLSRETRSRYIPTALTKDSSRRQHGKAARERLDTTRFIAISENCPGESVLLVDDVETTGTSLLQAAAELRRHQPDRNIRSLVLVKAGYGEKKNAENESAKI